MCLGCPNNVCFQGQSAKDHGVLHFYHLDIETAKLAYMLFTGKPGLILPSVFPSRRQLLCAGKEPALGFI